jgi:cobalt-zinc-cadmium efflux system outer membrane protein
MFFILSKAACYTRAAISIMLLLSINAFANNIDENCVPVKEPNDILKCLQIKHPEVISDKKISEVSEKLAAQGNAWKNPEVSFETVGGHNYGSSIFDSELRVSQTIEFSGQRAARKKHGKALGDAFLADSLSKVEDVTLVGVRSLYRLTQLKNEVEKIEESIQRFKLIKNQYQNRPRLNPEQEITLGIIQLAISEFEIKLNQINTEKKEIISELVSTTNLSSKELMSNLPRIKEVWPELSNSSDTRSTSSLILKSEADLNLTKSALGEARASAWPEFTVSVILQNKIDGSLQYQMYGAGISMPFPLFQRNQGEKALRAVEFSKSQNIHMANIKKQESLMQNTVDVYQAAITNLKNTPSGNSIENKHKKAELLFSQGLISGPLIIETHKQIIEYTQVRNQEELKAIEALWKFYIFKGTFLSQKI